MSDRIEYQSTEETELEIPTGGLPIGEPAAGAPSESIEVRSGSGVGSCPEGYCAAYENPHFNVDTGGRVIVFDESVEDLSKYDFDKCISSICNKSGKRVWLHSEKDGAGMRGDIDGRGYNSDLGKARWPSSRSGEKIDDDVSSILVVPH